MILLILKNTLDDYYNSHMFVVHVGKVYQSKSEIRVEDTR